MGSLTGKVTRDTRGSRARSSRTERMRACMSKVLVEL